MEYVVQQIMNAFAFGAEYALLALGLAIVFSIMGLVNFAHGEMIAVGGYTMVAAAALAVQNPLIRTAMSRRKTCLNGPKAAVKRSHWPPFTTPCVHFAMQGYCMKSPLMAPKAILTQTPMITPISIGKTTPSLAMRLQKN